MFEYFVDDFLVASEQVVLSKGQLNESICKNGKIGLNKSENKLFITFENGSMIYDTKAGFIDSYLYKNHEMINSFPLGDFKGFAACVLPCAA